MTPETTKRLERFFREGTSGDSVRIAYYKFGWWTVIGMAGCVYISVRGRTLNAAMRRFLRKAGY